MADNAVDARSSERITGRITELEARRYQAMLAGDLDELRRLLHPRLTYTHSNAERDDLGSYLQKVEDGHFNYLKIDHVADSLIVEDGCVVVVGHMRADVEVVGALRQIDNAALAVWVRADNGQSDWQLLAYQPTPCPRAA